MAYTGPPERQSQVTSAVASSIWDMYDKGGKPVLAGENLDFLLIDCDVRTHFAVDVHVYRCDLKHAPPFHSNLSPIPPPCPSLHYHLSPIPLPTLPSLFHPPPLPSIPLPSPPLPSLPSPPFHPPPLNHHLPFLPVSPCPPSAAHVRRVERWPSSQLPTSCYVCTAMTRLGLEC